nr:peptidase S41 [Patescibacteria group bacterium]
PGGYLQSSVYIAGEFSTDKVVLYQQSATGEEEAYKTDRVGVFTRIPKVFVLIDEGSASSSEILAAALKEHVGATLIGKKSFGKGTIQDAKNFEDGSGINITTSKWLTPTKEWIHHKGINPDVEVDGLLTADTKEGGVQPDKQLEKAIELAKQI